MDVRHFKLVTTISQVGSLSKAAEKLHLTQSALSHQLREIENELGAKLFNRVNQRLVLTESGKMFLNSSDTILKEMVRVKTEIGKELNGESGILRLTTECYTCYHWLPPILQKYQREFPNVNLRIRTQQTKPPLELLLQGKVDVVVTYKEKKDKNIVYTELFTDDVVAVVPVGNRLGERPYLLPADFADLQFITQFKNFEGTAFYQKFLKPHNIRPKRITYIQLTEAAIEMVKAGLGVTVMPRWLTKAYIHHDKIKLVKLGPKGLSRRWYVATLKSSRQTRFIARFAENMLTGISMSSPS